MDQAYNALRRAIQSGVVSPDDLSGVDLAQLLDMPQPRNDIAPMQANTMRVENGPDAGKVTNLNFSGQPGTPQAQPVDQPSGSMADLMAKFAAAKQPSQQMPNLDLSGQGGPKIMQPGGNPGTMRVVGSGNGAVVDLGTEPAKPPSLDYARGQIDIPGVGRGYYGKDGNAYVQNSDGSITKALLGYDLQGSMALNNYADERAKTQAQLAQTQAATEHTQEETRASKANNPDFGAMGGAASSGLTGDALLQTLDPGTAATVKSMLEGRMQPPGQMALRNPRVLQLINFANQVDPSFDATAWTERYKTAQDFSPGGKSGQVVQAINQALHHADNLSKNIDQLDNFNGALTALNAPTNWFEQKVLGHTEQGNFQTTANALSEELKKIYAGGGGSLTELQNWQRSFDPNASKEQQKAYLQTGMTLLQGAIDSRRQAFERGMGPKANFGKLIDPSAQAALDRIQGGGDAAAPSQSSMGLSVPSGAAAYLRAHPETRSDFDAKFGPGSAAMVLGR